jgi:hypothetical protein
MPVRWAWFSLGSKNPWLLVAERTSSAAALGEVVPMPTCTTDGAAVSSTEIKPKKQCIFIGLLPENP